MNIYETMNKIMKEIPAIGKNQNNKQQGFKYRGIDDVMNALQPLFAKYGLIPVPQVLERHREERTTKTGTVMTITILRIKYILYAEDGTYIEAITEGEAMDTADKSTSKAEAIAMKYALFQIFCIPTEDMAKDDPDAETPEPITPKELIGPQKTTPKKQIPPKKITYERRQQLVDRIKAEGIQNEYVLDKLKEHGYTKLADITTTDIDQIEKEIIGK